MKKFILTVALLGLTFTTLAADKLTIATSPTNPPFESLDSNGQLIGFDIDLAHALCQQMQVECSFTTQSFDSLIPALRFKKFDAVIASMDITPARSQQAAFSDPYYNNTAEVISLKSDNYHSFDNLKGKRVGVENGTTHQRYLQDKHPDIISVPYDSYQNAFIDLQSGRLAGVLGDTAAINHWTKTNPNLAPAISHITDPGYFGAGLGIAVRLDNTALLTRINHALSAIKANGVYQKIVDKWSM